MSSVRQIAREAGVSITTVSRVLNNHPRVSQKSREKVLAAANQARYVAPVSKRSTSNIALIYTGESSLGSPFDSQVMWGMSAGMEEYNYDLMVLDAKRSLRSGETFSQMFMRKGVRGAVLRTTLSTRHTCLAIADEGFPAVVIGDRFEHPSVRFIYSDSREPSREAVEHLIALGHQRIAICLNVIDDSDHADRLSGYEQAMNEHGLAIDRNLVIRAHANRAGGSQLIRRIASMADRPTALFVTDPATAAGAFKEARSAGLSIPNDLSIVGFDDGDLRFDLCPEMTAVCQDTGAIGREAMIALHEVIENGPGETLPVRKAHRAWLELHQSTAAPRASKGDAS
ncbi:MAG: LacI family DNA-binding transcriptional regulator [Planctomycetota bacterium]